MKLKSLIFVGVLVASGQSHAQELKNGVDYRLISPAQPTSSSESQIEVVEFFQYGCPACLALEPHLNAWLAEKPADVNFIRVHMVWNPLSKIHAQAFYAAEALGKSAEMHTAFFEEYHRNGNQLDTEDKLAAFFGRFGVSSEDFEKAFGSFAVHTKLQRSDELARRYRISGTPEVVVNGEYDTDPAMAGSYPKFFANLDKLIEMERAAP